MEFDMKGFRREHEGKRLRIEFTDGEFCEGELLHVSSCDEHYDCCGIIFELSNGVVAWSEMGLVRTFEVLKKDSA